MCVTPRDLLLFIHDILPALQYQLVDVIDHGLNAAACRSNLASLVAMSRLKVISITH